MKTLPCKPDLDQLKRQAKELLAAFQAGDPAAASEINTHYRGANAESFALHDAQLALARSYGFPSWTKLKAFVDGVTSRRLAEAVEAGDIAQVRALLQARPELVNMDMSENDEHRPLHYAVFARSSEMVRLLMEAGGDARKGVYPHRPATTPLTIARERGYDEIVAIIEQEEQRRRQAQNAADTEVTPAQDDVIDALWDGEDARAIEMMQRDPPLIQGADRRGLTPLHLAAATLNTSAVAWLLEHGADVNGRGATGRTPIDVADGTGWRRAGDLDRYPPVVEMLRRHGAELTARSAVAAGDLEWVRAHAGGLTDLVRGEGGLLSMAVRHDRPEMLRLLLDLGLDPDERTRVRDVEELVPSWGMPLHHCAGLGKHAMAEVLLERGADPNGQVYCSGSVMYSALNAKDEAMAQLLERYGGFADAATLGHMRLTDRARQMLADFDAGTLREGSHNPNGTLVGELLWAGLRGGDPEIVRMTLERVDWTRDNPEWFGKLWSPLPQGSARPEEEHARFLECFRLVLERCDPDIESGKFGRTVLHDLATPEDQTADCQAVDFATMLLDAGASTGIRDGLLKSTPLGWACRWGAIAMVKLLLSRGADPVEPDAEPWATPRAWAAKSGNAEVLALLGEPG